MMRQTFLWGLMTLVMMVSNASALALTAESWQTQKGIKVVHYPAHQVPMVAVKLGFAAGSAYDHKQFGLAALTNDLIGEQTRSLDATAIAERFADVGAQFGKQAGRSMAQLSLQSLSTQKELTAAIDNMALILSDFSVSEKTFKRVQQQQMVGLKATQQNANDVANNAFFQAIYGTHPYGHPVQGTLASVQALKPSDVTTFFKQHYHSNQAVLVLVGDLSKKTAQRIANKLDAALAKGSSVPPVAHMSHPEQRQVIEKVFPSSQTIIRMGQLGINHHNPDYFPLKIGNYILGGGTLVSRLSIEVREKRGLTYGVSSRFVPMPATGLFVIGLSTKQSQAGQAVDLTEQVMNAFIDKGPSALEIQQAKQYLVGSFPLSLSSNTKIANMLLQLYFFGLPADYLKTYVAKINAVTRVAVKQAMAAHLNPKKMTRVEVGQFPKTSSAS